MNQRLRVGIVGARGIGKHHAKWFARSGCEVVAVYGRTPESCGRAETALKSLFDFDGEMTADWDAFVRDPRLQAVSVGSPAEAHAEQVLALLAAGKDVLCEKPLVWDWEQAPDAMLGS